MFAAIFDPSGPVLDKEGLASLSFVPLNLRQKSIDNQKKVIPFHWSP